MFGGRLTRTTTKRLVIANLIATVGLGAADLVFHWI